MLNLLEQQQTNKNQEELNFLQAKDSIREPNHTG